MQDPILFALAVLTILGTPGPTNTLLATSGATVGWRRSLWLIPAEAAGYTIAILAIGLLLAPVLAAAPLLATALRVAVAAYLLLLAWRLWRGGAATRAAMVVTPMQVFVTTLLNPKALVFALGIVPFGATAVWPYLMGFLGLLVLVATSWIVVGSVLGTAAAGAGWDRAVPRVGAVAVGGFAVLLLTRPLLQ